VYARINSGDDAMHNIVQCGAVRWLAGRKAAIPPFFSQPIRRPASGDSRREICYGVGAGYATDIIARET